jgi:ketosteroid isomerase-like protein
MRKRGYLILTAALLFTACCAFAADQWTAEQKEVWAVEEKVWSLNKPTDMTEMLTYYHPDYAGWNYGNPVPSNKDRVNKWMSYWFGTGEVVVLDLIPMTIQVHGNFAFVHYYYRMVIKDKKGEEKMESGRWTDIWIKDGGKWLIIGDHGGQTSKD